MLKEKDVKLLLKHRYGSTKSFKKIIKSYQDIEKITGVRYGTVRNIIARYHNNGNRYVQKGTRIYSRTMIPSHAAEWLCKWDTLYNMRYLTMQARAKICKKEFGLPKCTANAVIRVYKNNGISYKLPGKANRLSDEREHKLIKERIAFARRLN